MVAKAERERSRLIIHHGTHYLFPVLMSTLCPSCSLRNRNALSIRLKFLELDMLVFMLLFASALRALVAPPVI